MREAGGLICNLDHREADDLFADEEALLEDLGDHILAQTLLLDVHHGVVPRGIKGFPPSEEAWFSTGRTCASKAGQISPAAWQS